MILNQNNRALLFGLAVLMGALAVMVLLGWVMPDVAHAETNIGDKLGDEVTAWGQGILLGVVALVGIPALARRDLGQAMVIALIAVVLGGFLWADTAIEDIVKKLWETIG